MPPTHAFWCSWTGTIRAGGRDRQTRSEVLLIGYHVPLARDGTVVEEGVRPLTIRSPSPFATATFVAVPASSTAAEGDDSRDASAGRARFLLDLIQTASVRDEVASVVRRPQYERQNGVDASNVLVPEDADPGRFGTLVEFVPARCYTPDSRASIGVRVRLPHFKTLGALEDVLRSRLPPGLSLETYDACRSPDDLVAAWYRRTGLQPFSWCVFDLRAGVDVEDWERRANARGGREVRVPGSAFSAWDESVRGSVPPDPPRRVLFFDFETLGASAKFSGADLIFLCNGRLVEFGGRRGGSRVLWNRSRILVPPSLSGTDDGVSGVFCTESYPVGDTGGSWPSRMLCLDPAVECAFPVSPADGCDEGGIFGGGHVVLVARTSQELLEGIAEDFRAADILCGHNVAGFDLPAFVKRARYLGVTDALRISKFDGEEFDVVERDTTTKNKGWNKVYSTRGLTGVDVYDTYTLFRNAKPPDVSSFSLEGMIQHVLKDETAGKDPVPYHRMHDLYQTPRGRHVLVRYCAKDTFRCQQCFVRKMWLGDVAAKCRLSGISAETCMNKGSTNKLVSLLSRPSAALPVPILFRSVPFSRRASAPEAAVCASDEDDEEVALKSGGYVSPPMSGIYRDPVGCHDFASLYPYIIIGFNVCFRTIGTWSHFRSLGKRLASFDSSSGECVDGEVFPIVRYHKFKPNPHHLMPKAPAVEPPLPSGASLFDASRYELVRESTLQGESAYAIYREKVRDDTPCVIMHREDDPSTHGVCPQMARRTLSLRKRYKSQMQRAERDLRDGGDRIDVESRRLLEQEVSACDSLQKAAKELCNSLFGVFGCPGGPLYNPMVADVIPKLGAMLNMLYTLETTERDWRSSIVGLTHPEGHPSRAPNASLPADGGGPRVLGADVVDRFDRFEVVYGDTDSIMVLAHGRDLTREEHCVLHHMLSHHLNSHCVFSTSGFKPPSALDIELENLYCPVIFMPKKKSYVYHTLDLKTLENSSSTKYKGVTCIKKNTERVSKDVQFKLFAALLTSGDDRSAMLSRAREIVLDACFRLDRDMVPPSHAFKTSMLNRDPGDLSSYLSLGLDAPTSAVNESLRGTPYAQEVPALRVIRRAAHQDRSVNWTERFWYFVSDRHRGDSDKLLDTLAQNVELLGASPPRLSVSYYVYNVILKQVESILQVAGCGKDDVHALFYDSEPVVQRTKRPRSPTEDVPSLRALRDALRSARMFLPSKSAAATDRAVNRAVSSCLRSRRDAGVSLDPFLDSVCSGSEGAYARDSHGFLPGRAPSLDELLAVVCSRLGSLSSGKSSVGRAVDEAVEAVEEEVGGGRRVYPKKGHERWPASDRSCPYRAFPDSAERVIDIEDSYLRSLSRSLHDECVECKRNCAANPSDEASVLSEVESCENRSCPTLFDRAWVRRRLASARDGVATA